MKNHYKNSTLYSGVFSSDNLPSAKAYADGYRESKVEAIEVEDTLTIDGIEVLVIYSQEGINIAVDKNHDLSYYVNGSDWVDSDEYNIPPGTFGYEWGGYNITTGITNTAVGSGLSNTNSLLEMSLQPETSNWYVVWDRIEGFRMNHSDNWFVPSKDELNLIYEARSNLSNLSLNTNYYYWSSSEYSDISLWIQNFSTGNLGGLPKYTHYTRARLCVQF